MRLSKQQTIYSCASERVPVHGIHNPTHSFYFLLAYECLRLIWWKQLAIDRQSVFINNGRFQKISVPYHGRLLGIPRARGVLWTGILKAWGGLDLGFTQATDKKLFLESSFLWTFLNQFVNRAWTSDILSLTPNNTIKWFLEYKSFDRFLRTFLCRLTVFQLSYTLKTSCFVLFFSVAIKNCINS